MQRALTSVEEPSCLVCPWVCSCWPMCEIRECSVLITIRRATGSRVCALEGCHPALGPKQEKHQCFVAFPCVCQGRGVLEQMRRDPQALLYLWRGRRLSVSSPRPCPSGRKNGNLEPSIKQGEEQPPLEGYWVSLN